MDFRNDEALMCAGLDSWFPSPPPHDCVLNEERLQRKLGCTHFIRPPDFSEDDGGSHIKIPYVRFPLWHYCPRCFRMKKAALFGPQPACDHCKAGSYPRRMIPSRVVAVCEEGHIQDFPYRTWIGCTCADDASAKLYFKAGRSSASLAGIKIECEACNRKRSLAGAFDPDMLAEARAQCQGGRPWLGETESETTCTHQLEAVQRGGSNVYFPLVASSIYIPPASIGTTPEVREAVEAYWDFISSAVIDGEPNRKLCDKFAERAKVDPDQFYAAARAKLGEAQDQQIAVLTEEEYRRQEFEVLSSGMNDPRSDLYCETIDGNRFTWLGRYIRKVGLVRKLRETRVLVGLSRVKPKSDRNDEGVQPLWVSEQGWFPAVDVRGEGIFIEFHDQMLMSWSAKVSQRVRPLVETYNRKRRGRGLRERNIDARFIALHTLSHALIKELTFTCGYGSASLRERLYCNIEDPSRPMNGLLIYTASGDSEGSLGGLVNQGTPGRLEALFLEALRRSEWCSNDPVCMESPGHGVDVPNLAACHACVLLPETSCEEGNRLLDRGLLVGTLDDERVGLFHGTGRT
ncbi:DUF1998 domain-containing protein [Bradyrhizobium neotropicale]|nr:DUF1998 domain-containing protein [Bradyrhizobium neotropicale]